MIAVFYSCCLVKNGKSDYIFSCDPAAEKYQRIDSPNNTTITSFIVTNNIVTSQIGDVAKGIPSILNTNFYAAYGS